MGYVSVSIGGDVRWMKPRLMELVLKETRRRWERSPRLASGTWCFGMASFRNSGENLKPLINKIPVQTLHKQSNNCFKRKDRIIWILA